MPGSIPGGPTKSSPDLMKGKSASFYILFSSSINRYYSGITTDDVDSRLLKHNTSHYGSHYTTAAHDWELRMQIHCDSYSMARKMELYVKRMKSRKFIEKIIEDPKQRALLIETIKNTCLSRLSGQ